MKTYRLNMITILIFAFLVLLIGCIKQSKDERIQPGEKIPDFMTYVIGGRNITAGSLIGKPSLIVFFSTTCPDCKAQLPMVEAAFKTVGEEANFLAIAREETDDSVLRFWKETGFTMPVAAPGKRDIYNLFDRGSGSGVPLMIFTDEKGIVTATSDDKSIMDTSTIIAKLFPEIND